MIMRKLLIACFILFAPAIASAQQLAVSADGKTLAVSHTGIYIFDTGSGTVRATFDHGASGGKIAISRSGKHLAVTTIDGLVLVDPQTGKTVRKLGPAGGTDQARSVAFSPDGKLLASGMEGAFTGDRRVLGRVEVFDVASGASKWTADAAFVPESIAWSRDGSRLAVDDLKSLRIFDAKGKELKKFGASAGFVAWSPDGTMIATVGGLTVSLYDVSSGELIAKKSYDTHDTPNHNGGALVFSPDGGWIGAPTKSGIDWYTVPDLTLKYTWQAPLGPTTELAYGAGETVYALGDFGRVRALDGAANKVKILQTLSPGQPDATPENTAAVTPEVKPETRPDVAPEIKVEPEKPPTKELTYDQKKALNAVEQAASYAAVWVGKLRHPDEYKDELVKPSFMQLAQSQGQDCQKTLAAARKLGIDEATPVDFNVYDSGVSKPQPLSEIDRLLCQPLLKAAGARVDALQAAKDAQEAPYLKVLSGDKAKIFVTLGVPYIVGCTGRCTGWYGRKMKRLKTPADFKKSDVWLHWVTYRDRSPVTWEVQGWVFKGMKHIGAYSKTGIGEDPPASAFK